MKKILILSLLPIFYFLYKKKDKSKKNTKVSILKSALDSIVPSSDDVVNGTLNTILDSNYDYLASARENVRINSLFKEKFSNWRSDPKILSSYFAKSLGVYEEWVKLMKEKVQQDPTYLTVAEQSALGIVASNQLQNAIDQELIQTDDPAIVSYLETYATFKQKLTSLIDDEPAAVSEYQARDVGLYERWKNNMEKKLAENPNYLSEFFGES